MLCDSAPFPTLLVNLNKTIDRLYSQTNRLYNSPPQYRELILSLHWNKYCYSLNMSVYQKPEIN